MSAIYFFYSLFFSTVTLFATYIIAQSLVRLMLLRFVHPAYRSFVRSMELIDAENAIGLLAMALLNIGWIAPFSVPRAWALHNNKITSFFWYAAQPLSYLVTGIGSFAISRMVCHHTHYTAAAVQVFLAKSSAYTDLPHYIASFKNIMIDQSPLATAIFFFFTTLGITAYQLCMISAIYLTIRMLLELMFPQELVAQPQFQFIILFAYILLYWRFSSIIVRPFILLLEATVLFFASV